MLLFFCNTRNLFLTLLLGALLTGCNNANLGLENDRETMAQTNTIELSDAEIENIVRRSYQYVAMYNVNSKGAIDDNNPFDTDGWNKTFAQTELLDHTVKLIARPNNDTLYVLNSLDLTVEPIILEAPAFDSNYASLQSTGYDHYVNIPLSSSSKDFDKPSRILLYTARTPGYKGEAVDGVDKVVEVDSDFISAVYRVMPHSSEPKRLAKIREAVKQVKIIGLSEFLGGEKIANTTTETFPAFGRTDADVFENNLLKVMQFVFNHNTFDPENPLDNALLAAYKPLGIVPGQSFDTSKVAKIDGKKFRQISEQVKAQALADMANPQFVAANFNKIFKPKGEMELDILVFQSVVGPAGQPFSEATYPPVLSADAQRLNAQNDYVVRMEIDQLPPAKAFWSITLYDEDNGFFIPNDRKKYSVGQNGGMKLDETGGISIHISAEQPEGVPAENWLPIDRGDYGINLGMRIYNPDFGRLQQWRAPKAEKVQ